MPFKILVQWLRASYAQRAMNTVTSKGEDVSRAIMCASQNKGRLISCPLIHLPYILMLFTIEIVVISSKCVCLILYLQTNKLTDAPAVVNVPTLYVAIAQVLTPRDVSAPQFRPIQTLLCKYYTRKLTSLFVYH